jgi:polysaccharide export outer membrane protein
MTGPLKFGSLSLCKFSLRIVVTAALIAGGPQLWAQFTGPSLSIPTQANISLTPTTDPALLIPVPTDFPIEPGDSLTINVYGATQFAPAQRVDGGGTIQLPLIGDLQVAGLTLRQVADLVARRLTEAGMYINPQVTVTGGTDLTSRFITVTGEMHMSIPVTGPRTLLEVLGAGGGLPKNASHVLTIFRRGATKPIIVDLGNDPAQSLNANIQIMPRDVIVVSRVGVVYVLGAFKTQGAIPLEQNTPLTLLELASIEGGAKFEGKYNDLRIIRTEGLERRLVKVDYRRIVKGLDPDPVLMADDIVYLPTSLWKESISSGGISTAFSILSLVISVIDYTRY